MKTITILIPIKSERTAWQSTYFGVTVQGINPGEIQTVLLTGQEPTADLLSVIDSKIVTARQANKQMYSLLTQDDHDNKALLASYGLAKTTCTPLVANYSHVLLKNDAYYQLCKLQPIAMKTN